MLLPSVGRRASLEPYFILPCLGIMHWVGHGSTMDEQHEQVAKRSDREVVEGSWREQEHLKLAILWLQRIVAQRQETVARLNVTYQHLLNTATQLRQVDAHQRRWEMPKQWLSSIVGRQATDAFGTGEAGTRSEVQKASNADARVGIITTCNARHHL